MSTAATAPTNTSKYRALLELGQGGTAVVYLAVAQGPVGFNKLVVLKVLKSGLGNDPEFRRMFLNEARLSARLNHPNIVQVNEVTEQDRLPIIVMEYLEGQPLSALRQRAGADFPLPMQLRVISEVLSGLHYSHELTDYDGARLNVVHRDMTPHNVMLTYDGSVKILDFGIAKLNASLIETQTGVIKGKLRYMPPEQISGDQVDRRADVFAVGVMLWEAATNIRMWGKMSEAAIMNAVLKGDVPSPREENPTLDPELERIIMKALAYEPDDRYASAADLQTDIDAYLGSMSTAVTNREIGAFVTKQFEAARSETKKIVEEQLKQSSLSAAESKGLISFPPGPLPPRATTYTASTTLGTNGTSLNGAQGGPRRLAAAAAATLLVAAAASAAVWKISAAPAEHEAARGASTPSASTAPVAPPKDSAPAEVLLRITAFPVSARLFLDDRELPGNPYSSSVKFDKSPHAIRAEAEGHVSSSVAVSFDRDRDVVITLETQKPVVAPKKQTTTRRAPSEPASTPPAPNCNPPYFIEDGIKKFKPGCLR